MLPQVESSNYSINELDNGSINTAQRSVGYFDLIHNIGKAYRTKFYKSLKVIERTK